MTMLRPFPLPEDSGEIDLEIYQFCEAYFEQRNIRVERLTVQVSAESPLSSSRSSWLFEKLNALLVHACTAAVDVEEVEVELVEANGVFDIELYVSSEDTTFAQQRPVPTRTAWSADFLLAGSANHDGIDCVTCPQGGTTWRARVGVAPQLRRVA